MIVTVTPNPLLDYILTDPGPLGSGPHRVERLPVTVGGKGINVARMLKTLGLPALAVAFAGGANGAKIRDLLRQEGLSSELIPTMHETRAGINLVVSSPPLQTWWLEDGEPLLESEIQALLARLCDLVPRVSIVAMSGTIPGKTGQDLYRRVLETLANKGFKGLAALDARGKALQEALQQGGFFLKHNREEARQTFGLDPFSSQDLPALIDRWDKARLPGVMVTDGPGPVLFWQDGRLTVTNPPQVREISAVGSGDAALAGLLYAFRRGLPRDEALAWSLAAGAADAGEAGPCQASLSRVSDCLQRIVRVS